MPKGIYKRKSLSREHKEKIGNANKNNTPWNKNLTKEIDERVKKYSKKLKGLQHQSQQGFQKGNTISVGEKNGMYGKTDNKNPLYIKNATQKLKIQRLHKWITKIKGKASKYICVDCGNQAKDWSNVDHSYKQKLKDYLPRCSKCHNRYDREILKIIMGRPKN